MTNDDSPLFPMFILSSGPSGTKLSVPFRDDFHAPLAERGMLGAQADAGPVVPAPLALGVGGSLDSDRLAGRCRIGDDLDLGDDAERGQQVAIGQPAVGTVGRDPDLGLLGAADLLGLPQTLQGEEHLLAEPGERNGYIARIG